MTLQHPSMTITIIATCADDTSCVNITIACVTIFVFEMLAQLQSERYACILLE